MAPRDRGGRNGPAAEHVEPPQGGGALNDGGEADCFAGRGQAGDRGQQGEPRRAGQAGRRGHPEQCPECVGARVTEHRPFTEVLGEQGGGGAERRGHRREGPRAGRTAARAHGQQRSAGQGDLEGAPGAQVEQVQQVRAPGDKSGIDRDVGWPAPQQHGRRQAGRADAAQLDRPRGDLAMDQGTEVPAEPAPAPAAGQVVIPAERRRPRARQRQRGPDPGRQARPHRGAHDAGPGERGSFQQGDRLAPVVGPGPAGLAAGRPPGQDGVGGAGRAGGGRPRSQCGGGTGPEPSEWPGLLGAGAHGVTVLDGLGRAARVLAVPCVAGDVVGAGVGGGLGPAALAVAVTP